MLELLLTAAIRTLTLSLIVGLALRALRIQHPQLNLAAWTAVLFSSLAMPVLQYGLSLSPIAMPPLAMSWPVDAPASYDGHTDLSWAASQVPFAGVVAAESNVSWWAWLSAVYLIVTAILLLRLVLGLALIAHEMSHVASRDFYIQALAGLNRAIFWFNPAAWRLCGRLARFAEMASDDAAVDAIGDGPSYAIILLDMARRSGPVSSAVAMARPATVRERIERILRQDETPRPVTMLKRAGLALCVLPLAAVVSIATANVAAPSTPAIPLQRTQPRTIVAVDTSRLDAYAGIYRNGADGSVIIVTRDGDHLMSRRLPEPARAAYPTTDRDFFFAETPLRHRFITDTSGAVVSLVHHAAGQTETLERLTPEDGQRAIAVIDRRVAEENALHAEIKIDPKLLDLYVGAYRFAPVMMLTVTRDGDRLLARLTGQQAFEVRPYTNNDFFYTVAAAQLTFVKGQDGRIRSVILRRNGRYQMAGRVDPALAQELDRKRAEQSKPRKAITIDPALIERYVGRYLNRDMEIRAGREGNQLFIQVTGMGRYAVYPYTKSDFFAAIVPAQLSFVTDGNGDATQTIRRQFGTETVLKRVE